MICGWATNQLTSSRASSRTVAPRQRFQHVPPGSGTTLWAVNFDGPVHHHPVHDLTRLVLRHTYGDVTAISADNTAITITMEFPTEPAVSPETAVVGAQSLQILADATNGTIMYDVDAKTNTVIDNFSTESSLVGKYLRIAARYQQDGTLVATRIWASGNFNSVWLSPEGHVLHVNADTHVLTVSNEAGQAVALNVDANTQFFFRQPWNATADASPIATGTGFLANKDLVRGFKVHASVVDPLATPLVAQSIDIETAQYSGQISSPGPGELYLCSHGGCRHDLGICDAGVPGRSHRQHHQRELDRCHHLRRSCHAGYRPGRG